MGEIRTFRDLEAWKVGMDLVELTYRLTSDFPDDERFGLVAQMRRASVSIPSNVAEGNAMTSPKWTLRYLLNAIGSSCELETQLEAALRLRYCTSGKAGALQQQLDRVQKLLYGLKRERERRLGAVGAVISFVFFVFIQSVG